MDTEVSVVKEINGALLSWFDSISLGILPEKFPAQICHVSYAETDMFGSEIVGYKLHSLFPSQVSLSRYARRL